MAILRYPLRVPVDAGDNVSSAEGATGAVDYVSFQRQRINYKDSGAKYYGRAFPDTNRLELDSDDNRVYLAMPKQLQTQYTPQYRQVDVGVAGIAALSAISGDLEIEAITSAVQGAAQAGLPEFATGALAQAINGFSQMGGLVGNIDANAIQALTRGRVFNPFKEQVFQNMNFRTHNFSFKLLSRSPEEAREIHNIIRYFKAGATPRLAGQKLDFNEGAESVEKIGDVFENKDAQLASSNRFFEIPDSFRIKFLRVSADGRFSSAKDISSLHFNIHPSVCTGINVNYTPDGQYTSFKDAGKLTGTSGMVQVPAIQLNLSFTELKLVTSPDTLNGF